MSQMQRGDERDFLDEQGDSGADRVPGGEGGGGAEGTSKPVPAKPLGATAIDLGFAPRFSRNCEDPRPGEGGHMLDLRWEQGGGDGDDDDGGSSSGPPPSTGGDNE